MRTTAILITKITNQIIIAMRIAMIFIKILITKMIIEFNFKIAFSLQCLLFQEIIQKGKINQKNSKWKEYTLTLL